MLDYYGLTESYRSLRTTVHGRPRGFDGQADAGLGRGDPRRRRTRSRPASAARSASRAFESALSARVLAAAGGEDRGLRRRVVHTKDAARQDEDGYSGTKVEPTTSSSAGYRIGPFEVESACLDTRPCVRRRRSPHRRAARLHRQAFIVLAEQHSPSRELAEEIKVFVESGFQRTHTRVKSNSSTIFRRR